VPDFSTSIDIDAPPEVVFAYLVTAEGILSWMGEHVELEPYPGGRFAVDINGVPFRGQYLEIDPPHRVVVSWGIAGRDDFAPGSSRVEFTLRPTATGTALSLLHLDLPDAAKRTHATGWSHYLGRLRLVCGGADPGPDSWIPGREPEALRRT